MRWLQLRFDFHSTEIRRRSMPRLTLRPLANLGAEARGRPVSFLSPLLLHSLSFSSLPPLTPLLSLAPSKSCSVASGLRSVLHVETHDRQWSSIALQLYDFLVVCDSYIKLMKTLFHDWARKANDRRRRISLPPMSPPLCLVHTLLFPSPPLPFSPGRESEERCKLP